MVQLQRNLWSIGVERKFEMVFSHPHQFEVVFVTQFILVLTHRKS